MAKEAAPKHTTHVFAKHTTSRRFIVGRLYTRSWSISGPLNAWCCGALQQLSPAAGSTLDESPVSVELGVPPAFLGVLVLRMLVCASELAHASIYMGRVHV